LHGSSSGALSQQGLNPSKLAYLSAGWPAPSTASAFNRLGHSVPTVVAYSAYCFAELAVSSLAVAVTITNTHYAHPLRDGQAELAWVAWVYGVPANGHTQRPHISVLTPLDVE